MLLHTTDLSDVRIASATIEPITQRRKEETPDRQSNSAWPGLAIGGIPVVEADKIMQSKDVVKLSCEKGKLGGVATAYLAVFGRYPWDEDPAFKMQDGTTVNLRRFWFAGKEAQEMLNLSYADKTPNGQDAEVIYVPAKALMNYVFALSDRLEKTGDAIDVEHYSRFYKEFALHFKEQNTGDVLDNVMVPILARYPVTSVLELYSQQSLENKNRIILHGTLDGDGKLQFERVTQQNANIENNEKECVAIARVEYYTPSRINEIIGEATHYLRGDEIKITLRTLLSKISDMGGDTEGVLFLGEIASKLHGLGATRLASQVLAPLIADLFHVKEVNEEFPPKRLMFLTKAGSNTEDPKAMCRMFSIAAFLLGGKKVRYVPTEVVSWHVTDGKVLSASEQAVFLDAGANKEANAESDVYHFYVLESHALDFQETRNIANEVFSHLVKRSVSERIFK